MMGAEGSEYPRIAVNHSSEIFCKSAAQSFRDVEKALLLAPTYYLGDFLLPGLKLAVFHHIAPSVRNCLSCASRLWPVGRYPCIAEFLLAATAQNLRRLARLRPASARMEIMA